MGVLGQKGRFWTIFGQKGAIFEFSVKRQKCHFFTHFCSFFNTRKSENSNAGIFGKMGARTTDERTDERTNGGESKGQSTPSRDQKAEMITKY